MKMLSILGGDSHEKEIIFGIMKEIIDTAEEIGIECETFHYQNNLRELLDYIEGFQPDVISVAVLGEEGGGVYGLLKILRIPLFGSSQFSSMITDRKHLAKLMLKDAGFNVPIGFLLRSGEKLETQEILDRMNQKDMVFPVIVKPNSMGSKMGISYVVSANELMPAIEKAFQYDQPIVVEEFIPGRELSVSVIVDGESVRILHPMDALHEDRSVDFMINQKVTYVEADNISKRLQQNIENLVDGVIKEFELTSFFRIDVIVTEDEEPYVLEVTTAPGLSSTSVFPQAALASGMSRQELIQTIISSAIRNHR